MDPLLCASKKQHYLNRGYTKCDSFESHVVRCCHLFVLTFNLFTWYKNQRSKSASEWKGRGNKVNNEWTHFSTSFNSTTPTVVAPLFTRSLEVNFCIDTCIICIKEPGKYEPHQEPVDLFFRSTITEIQ